MPFICSLKAAQGSQGQALRRDCSAVVLSKFSHWILLAAYQTDIFYSFNVRSLLTHHDVHHRGRFVKALMQSGHLIDVASFSKALCCIHNLTWCYE